MYLTVDSVKVLKDQGFIDPGSTRLRYLRYLQVFECFKVNTGDTDRLRFRGQHAVARDNQLRV